MNARATIDSVTESVKWVDPSTLKESYGKGRGYGPSLDKKRVDFYVKMLERGKRSGKMKEALRDAGFPIHVWKRPSGDLMIGDGHHRVRAAVITGIRIPVIVSDPFE